MIDLYLFIPNIFLWFCCCLLVVIMTSILMNRQSCHFYYFDGSRKKFSIFNLQFPVSRCYLTQLFRQINQLPDGEADLVFKKLRGQLYTDFFFMPGAYLGIGLFCMEVASKYHGLIHCFLALLAWSQLLAWLLDIIENLYLLSLIKNPKIITSFFFICYRVLEILKWGLSLGGFLSALGFALYLHCLY